MMKRRTKRRWPGLKLEVPTVLVGVRVPQPIWERFEDECRRRGQRPGAFLAALIDKAIPAAERKEAEDGNQS